MKKFLCSLLVCAMAYTAGAQVQNMVATNGLTVDTISNTGSLNKNLTLKVKESGSISLVLTITKISGTVGGTATLQGSNDGTNYADLQTAYTITDASQVKSYDFDKTKYLYYRFKCAGTGTMSASVKANVLNKAQ